MTEAGSLLAAGRRETGAALPIAILAGVTHGLLAIAVAWTLAGLVDGVVLGGEGLTEATPRLVVLAALAAVRAVLVAAADGAAFRAAARVRRHLFRRLLDHVVALGPVRLAGRPTGEIVATLTDAVAAVEPYWRGWIPVTAKVAVIPLAVLIAVVPFDRVAALVFVATMPLLPWFMILVGRGAEAVNRRQWQTLARLGGHLLDAIKGLAELKIFGASKREIAVVAAMAEGYRRDTMAVLRIAFLSALVLEFFATLSIAVIAVTVGFRLMWGTMEFHAGLFILLLAPEFYAPLRRLGAERHARMEAVAAAERLVDLLDRPGPSRPAGTARPTFTAAVEIRLEGVDVTHADGRVALFDLELTIAPGERIALVGPSGAGKSTLFALLLGLVEPSRGRVLIDGVDLAAIDPAQWRRAIAHIPQRPHLFDATIDDAVAMGRAPASGTREAAIAAALRAAQAEAFVARLPEGRATRLGERGLGLSGGEAQRLALARAFYAPGPLVLFDEPTAHLDRDTEALVVAAIDDLARGRTTLTIAHRLDTVARADRVVVLDCGRIVETGSAEALRAAGGRFAAMAAAAERRDDRLIGEAAP
ncbi:thiol reductant ABC exporter subunit CydD [Pinisolibacter aquiterrae]|uniref:thiol reductant ABC exporter subunit CydD n=1 Tax=Pinisolibacter aquiterrae TaxID=2815579 RepID=UPI001E42D6BE|nr:thiol reductant ABC exporter subunit CydD [Pinisolibacter aquiterrae]MCC8234838.1 thiol reductant ABC exporter subunit CydD [Pinisolibacter aquiterrae]